MGYCLKYHRFSSSSRGLISTGVDSLCTRGIDTDMISKVFEFNPYNNNIPVQGVRFIPMLKPNAKAVGLSLPLDLTPYTLLPCVTFCPSDSRESVAINTLSLPTGKLMCILLFSPSFGIFTPSIGISLNRKTDVNSPPKTDL